jgi:hypothetical protein
MLYAAIFQTVNSVIVTADTLYAALSSVLALLSRPCSMQLFYAALSSVLALLFRPCSMQLYIICSIIFSIGSALQTMFYAAIFLRVIVTLATAFTYSSTHLQS